MAQRAALARTLAALSVTALALAACGGSAGAPDPARSPASPAPTATPDPADPPAAREPAAAPDPAPFRPVTCPAGLAGCRTATGRVLYVEAVDPDGDGDAHYVIAGGDITAPGISVIDVRRDLRPRRLPRPGERVSAAGPVFTGSYGQRQIEAVRIRHDR